jgi:hypothetical protein
MDSHIHIHCSNLHWFWKGRTVIDAAPDSGLLLSVRWYWWQLRVWRGPCVHHCSALELTNRSAEAVARLCRYILSR